MTQELKSTKINYICPVSGRQIDKFAEASDLYFYEEQNIIELLENGANSPITGQPFSTNVITRYLPIYTSSIYPDSLLSLDS